MVSDYFPPNCRRGGLGALALACWDGSLAAQDGGPQRGFLRVAQPPSKGLDSSVPKGLTESHWIRGGEGSLVSPCFLRRL